MGERQGPGREQVVSACQVRPFQLYSSHQGQASEGACGSGREEGEEGGSAAALALPVPGKDPGSRDTMCLSFLPRLRVPS